MSRVRPIGTRNRSKRLSLTCVFTRRGLLTLYEHVEKHGTPSRWTENDAGLQDVEQEDEAD